MQMPLALLSVFYNTYYAVADIVCSIAFLPRIQTVVMKNEIHFIHFLSIKMRKVQRTVVSIVY